MFTAPFMVLAAYHHPSLQLSPSHFTQLLFIICNLVFLQSVLSFLFHPHFFIGLSPILLSIFSQSFSILGQVGRLVLLLMSSRTKRVGPSHLHNSLTTTMNHTFNLTLLPTRQTEHFLAVFYPQRKETRHC